MGAHLRLSTSFQYEIIIFAQDSQQDTQQGCAVQLHINFLDSSHCNMDFSLIWTFL